MLNTAAFNLIVSKLPLGICVLDRDFRIQYWNDFFASRLNFTEPVIGKNLLELFPEQARFLKKKLTSVLVLNNSSFSYWEHRPHLFDFNSSRPITGEETLMFQNLEIVPLDVNDGEVQSLCLILQDVTEQASYFQAQKQLAEQLEREHAAQVELVAQLQKTQQQLVSAEKMSSIGQLAAGIAHEINNPLGFIRSNLQSLQDYNTKLFKAVHFVEKLLIKTASPNQLALKDDFFQRLQLDFIKDDCLPLIAESLEGAERVSHIINSLRAFSHVNDEVWQLSDLRKNIDSTLQVLANELKYKTQIHCTYGDALVPIYCQPMQLNQVFLILIMNAVQAITDHGEIWIEITQQASEQKISVRDNGCGMTEEVKKRVFEPFFTTKEVGKGTGLGLSMAYSIIQAHHGRIEIDSTPGVGTTFNLYLPNQQQTE